MPTIIALDISLSMQRTIPGRSDHTYHQLALKGITHLLDNLAASSKLEYISLVTYASTCEVKVDFTRDYDQIRQAVKKIEASDKACLLTMLKNVATLMVASWGAQNVCQVVVFTDCGIGFGSTAIKGFLQTASSGQELREKEHTWLKTLKSIKLNFICMGLHSDSYFTRAAALYQELLDFTGLKGQLFMTKPAKDATLDASDANSNASLSAATAPTSGSSHSSHKNELGRTAMFELIERLCEASFRPLETILKCGSYFRLECAIYIWPPPLTVLESAELTYTLAPKLEVCGYIALSDIGSPASLSRHLILPKVDRENRSRRTSEKSSSSNAKHSNNTNNSATNKLATLDVTQPNYEYEKLEQDIRDFYTKDAKDTDESGDDAEASGASGTLPKSNSAQSEYQKESLCVLLHGALKMENMAALVLLADNWFGFIYAFADSKKKSNLMLNVLPPGSNVIPWLGDLNSLGFAEDLQPGETSSFPVKSEKRSYSQNCVVWIRHASLQSDVQKVLRHAKKMPDKMQHFYKELNRIRRAALSIGFVELLEALATLLEKECAQMTLNTESTLQLQHAASELRKTNRDLKVSIVPWQKFVATSTAAAAVAGGSGGNTEGAPGFIY